MRGHRREEPVLALVAGEREASPRSSAPASSVARNAVAASRISFAVVVSRAPPAGASTNDEAEVSAARTGRASVRGTRCGSVDMWASPYSESEWTVHFTAAAVRRSERRASGRFAPCRSRTMLQPSRSRPDIACRHFCRRSLVFLWRAQLSPPSSPGRRPPARPRPSTPWSSASEPSTSSSPVFGSPRPRPAACGASTKATTRHALTELTGAAFLSAPMTGATPGPVAADGRRRRLRIAARRRAPPSRRHSTSVRPPLRSWRPRQTIAELYQHGARRSSAPSR